MKDTIWDSYVPDDKPMYLFDLEADDLDPTKIHCVSYCLFNEYEESKIKTITDPEKMKAFFSSDSIFMGHNIYLWDLPCAVQKLLGIDVIKKSRIIDSLWLSKYICHSRTKHGLEYWGEDLGVEKPKIEDWSNQTLEEYIHRCEEDVRINQAVFRYIYKKLRTLYTSNEELYRFIWYLMYMADVIEEQSKSRWKLDEGRAMSMLHRLEQEKEEKVSILTDIMPKNPKYVIKKKPKVMTKKSDGSISALGKKWLMFLEEQSLPKDYEEDVKYIKSYEPGNPNSHDQMKAWFFSMGWEPKNYDVKKDDKTKRIRRVPQLRIEVEGEKVLCPSVVKLFEVEPRLQVLEGITVLTHRIGIFKGFLRDVDEEGYLTARASGITNTLRYTHKEIVNLPKNSKPYGKDVRGCLIAPEGYELVGSDLCNLENRTRDLFIYHLDPDYVEAMSEPGYDSHIETSVVAGLMTRDEANFFKDIKGRGNDNPPTPEEHKEYDRINNIRSKGKTTNFASVYGVGAPKLALTLECPESEAKGLLKAYWKINWAVKEVAKNLTVKVLSNGEMWLYNPLSKFWYSLRYDKDRFSTLNQSAGTFIFMSWIKCFRNRRPQITGNMHDEVILCIKKGEGYREKCEKFLHQAIQEVNDKLELERPMAVDVDFGNNYSEIH